MAEKDEESSLMSYDIERSIHQVIDTQEDEDDDYSIGTNVFFNEANSRFISKKFGDNVSDYAGRRSNITNIDNQSMNSNQDRYISLVQDEMSLDDNDRTSNYFIPFIEPENRFIGADHHANYSKSVSSAIVSDKMNDEFLSDFHYKDTYNFIDSKTYIDIVLGEYENIGKVIDWLLKQKEDQAKHNIKIECHAGQLSAEDIQSVFQQVSHTEQIQLYDKITGSLLATHFRKSDRYPEPIGVGLDEATPEESYNPCFIPATPKREPGKGHQKCKSMSETEEWKGKLTKDEPYKDASSTSKKMNGLNSPGQNIQSHKFTCRYEIQIENDKEFQVARRLIGAKGHNMKQIIENCKHIGDLLEKEGYGKVKIQDLVKLRLRGRGSGFKEGPRNEESNEPLHLCISSKYPQTFDKACELTEELLNNVYDEYFKHQNTKNPGVKRLKIKKFENNYSRRNSGSSNNSNKKTKKKHMRNQSHGGGSNNMGAYGSTNNGSKHNSDSKKYYPQSPLVTCFDSYGMFDPVMQAPTYGQPPALNFMKSNSYYKPSYGGRKLFGDTPIRAPNKNSPSFYPSSNKPKQDFK